MLTVSYTFPPIFNLSCFARQPVSNSFRFCATVIWHSGNSQVAENGVNTEPLEVFFEKRRS